MYLWCYQGFESRTSLWRCEDAAKDCSKGPVLDCRESSGLSTALQLRREQTRQRCRTAREGGVGDRSAGPDQWEGTMSTRKRQSCEANTALGNIWPSATRETSYSCLMRSCMLLDEAHGKAHITYQDHTSSGIWTYLQ